MQILGEEKTFSTLILTPKELAKKEEASTNILLHNGKV
jgi:hypothetical protein